MRRLNCITQMSATRYSQLINNGFIINTKGYAAVDLGSDCVDKYEWMRDQMLRAGIIGNAFVADNYFPIWCWVDVSECDKEKIPPSVDLIPGNYLVKFSISEDKILLSDFDLWHCPLNNAAITIDEEESDMIDALDDPAAIRATWGSLPIYNRW